MCYTSGTTGRPKGVMLSHDSCLASTHLFMYRSNFNYNYQRGSMRRVTYLPLSHVLGFCYDMIGGIAI